MKRRYKQGDWFAVPLGGAHGAVGVIARACRSRLFGYFFAVPASYAPSHEELRALQPRDAVAALLFGGSAIEEARWPVLATSLAFDPARWPFPDFASRGAFGRTWTRVTYDPLTLGILAREPVDPGRAALLADARFADAAQAEALLRRRIAGAPAPAAQIVYEVRSPVDREMLRVLEPGGRLQFGSPVSNEDLDVLARFLETHPHVALRVHGFARGFDAASLVRFSSLRDLTLDVRAVEHGAALGELRSLRALRIGGAAIDLEFLDNVRELRRLELRGTRARLEPVRRLCALEHLVLENTAALDVRELASAPRLESLTLSHGEYQAGALAALGQLRALELHALDLERLPAFAGAARLERLRLRGLAGVTDLRPLAQASALRELRIEEMPGLNVRDFEPLRLLPGLRLELAIGSRRKEREVYRLLRGPGGRCQLQVRPPGGGNVWP